MARRRYELAVPHAQRQGLMPHEVKFMLAAADDLEENVVGVVKLNEVAPPGLYRHFQSWRLAAARSADGPHHALCVRG